MTLAKNTPFAPVVEDGVAIWKVPLANGAVPFTALEDCGYYVKWLFDNNAEAADGLDLEVGVEHVTFDEYTRAFTKVTGKPARWVDVELDGHMDRTFGPSVDKPAGYNADPNDPATLTIRQNFTAFFQIFRHSGGNKGILKRDYEFLDEIHPQRIKTVEQWLRREEEKSISSGLGSLWDRAQNLSHVIKALEDGRAGKI
jgi:hypothetical protein